jgi:hypothetical protein
MLDSDRKTVVAVHGVTDLPPSRLAVRMKRMLAGELAASAASGVRTDRCHQKLPTLPISRVIVRLRALSSSLNHLLTPSGNVLRGGNIPLARYK